MGARSSGREAALQILFAIDTAAHPADRAIVDFWAEFPGEAEGRTYADELVRRIFDVLPELDEAITASAANWRIERMTRVDRNILRVGAYELLHRPDVPLEVIIDEAVELAKRYGADQSSAFVNGVLDKLASEKRGKS
jgi:transcription antitermination protein NusB